MVDRRSSLKNYKKNKPLPRILLLIDKGTGYGRGLLKGIAEYSLLHGPWSFYWDEPFYCSSRQNLSRILKEWKPDGIIVRIEQNLDKLVFTDVPIVYAADQKLDMPCSAPSAIYYCDWNATSKMAAEHFVSQGFRNFAYCGYGDIYWSRQRGAAYRGFLQDKGFDASIYESGDESKIKSWNKELPILADWLKKLPKPLGLMACNDDRAQQILEACKFADVLIPEEIAIVGVDNDELICTLSAPQLSSVNLNPVKTGYEISSLLDELMQKGKTDRVVVDKPTHVEIRQSTDILAIDDVEIVKAMRFIRDNCRDMIQICDVVEQTCLSKRALELRFKKVLGFSILDEIKRCKINEVSRLLLTTNWSITEIAMHMGFSGSDHIARYFSQVKGMSAIKFRQKYKG
jgi:LacI family transcriptional regulator